MTRCREVVVSGHTPVPRGIRWRCRVSVSVRVFLVMVLLYWVGLRAVVHAATGNEPSDKSVHHIVYGGDERFPPYEFIDKNGKPAGLNVDLIRAIGRAKGFSVDVRLSSWSQVRDGLARGRIDVAAMYRSSLRVHEVDFCIPHELVYHEMFVRTGGLTLRGLADLAGKRVLVEGDTYSAETLMQMGFGNQVIAVPNEPTALLELARGVGDVALVTQTVGRPFRERLSLNRQIVPTGPPVLLSEYAFVTRKGRFNLVEQLNEGLSALRANGEYDKAREAWLALDRSARYLDIAGWVLAIMLFATLAVVAWNWTLRRRVTEQTKALLDEFNDKVEAQKALRTVEDSLRNAQRMEALGRFAGSIAHDFNNILTVILNYGNFQRERLLELNVPTDDIDQILLSSERAARLTRQLLAFSRATPTETTAVDFCALLQNCKPMLERLVGEHVRIEITCPDTPLVVRGESTQFEQILLNFSANARDAMPNGGRLRFELASDSIDEGNPWKLSARQYVLLKVSDDGIGMDEALVSRIYEPFFTTKEAGKGTGLGLATVYANVTKLGGAIEVVSRLGQGTTFTVFLPEALASSLAQPRDVVVEPLGYGSEFILLVEDEDALRVAARIALERAGHRVVEASNGEEAERVAQANDTLTLLVTDVVMPRKNGPQLVESLRRTKPQLKVLYTSGYIDDRMPLDLKGGSTLFLAKPYSGRMLVDAVRKLSASAPTASGDEVRSVSL